MKAADLLVVIIAGKVQVLPIPQGSSVIVGGK
jgi:hypothetical protein